MVLRGSIKSVQYCKYDIAKYLTNTSRIVLFFIYKTFCIALLYIKKSVHLGYAQQKTNWLVTIVNRQKLASSETNLYFERTTLKTEER